MDSDLNTVVRNPQRLQALRQLDLLDTASEEAFDRLTGLVRRILDVPVALVSLVDEERQFFKSCLGLPEPWASQRETPLSHSFCQYAVATGEPLVIEDARADPLFHNHPAIQDLGVVAYAGIPLLNSERQALGSFCAIDDQPRRWTAEELAILRDLAAMVMTEIALRTTIKENGRLLDEVQRLAITDSLTNIYNRRGFFELATREFERSRRYQHDLAAIMLDIDHFKQVNDHYGHGVGDEVLYWVSQQCQQLLRESDLLGRYGGEELVMLLPETGRPWAAQAAERICQAIAGSSIMTSAGPLSITISAGLAVLSPETPSLEALLARADAALYQAKAAGRNRVMEE